MPAQEAFDLRYDASESANAYEKGTRTQRLKNAYCLKKNKE